MNLGEIRSMTREYLNEPIAAFWSDAVLNSWINRSTRKVTVHIKNVSRYHFTTRANFQTVAGQEYYQLPANLKDLKYVSKLTTDGTELPLERAPWPNPFAWTEDPLPTSTSTSPNDVPAGYWIVGASIRLLPIAAGATTIRLYYEARLIDLVSDEDIPTLDEDYHDMVAIWAAINARIKNSEPTNDLAGLFKERREDLLADVFHRFPMPAQQVEAYLQGMP